MTGLLSVTFGLVQNLEPKWFRIYRFPAVLILLSLSRAAPLVHESRTNATCLSSTSQENLDMFDHLRVKSIWKFMNTHESEHVEMYVSVVSGAPIYFEI